MGRDIGTAIQELIDAADYTERKIDTDVTAYESQLESFNSMCQKVLEIIKNINNPNKQITSGRILHEINRIKKLIENET